MATISEYRARIASIDREISKKERQLEDLYLFQEQHSATISTITEHFSKRKNKVTASPLDSSKVKIFSAYRDKVDEFMQDVPKYVGKREEEQREIISAAQRTEQEIAELKQERASCEDRIRDLELEEERERLKGSDREDR